MAEKEGFHLDPNRKHTEAEAELVMYLFDCGREEAWGILNAKPSPEMMALARGMADALRLEEEDKRRSTTEEFESFLAAHAPIRQSTSFAAVRARSDHKRRSHRGVLPTNDAGL